MADRYDEQTGWPLGVLTAPPGDKLPEGAVLSARNAELIRTGTGQAVYRKRKGLEIMNLTTAGAPAVVGIAEYPYATGSGVTRWNVSITSDGVCARWQDDGSTNVAPTTLSGVALSNPCVRPDWVVALNRLFLVDDNGGKACVKDTGASDWGVPLVTYPGSPTALVGGGSMTGDYDLLVVGYNSTLLAESDWAPIISVTGLASQQITLTVNAVAAGLTHRWFRVYLRKRSLGGDFFRVLSGTGYNATHQAFALNSAGATVSTTINISDATFLTYVLRPAPAGTRGLPPAGVKTSTWWRRRLFLATDTTLYWSELDDPDAFGETNLQDLVDGRGGLIRAVKTVYDRVIILMTSGARFEITGDDDDRSWLIQMTDVEGSAIESPRAFAVVSGVPYWWTRTHGPVRWDGSEGPPEPIGWQTIRPSFDGVVSLVNLDQVIVDGVPDRVLFGFPQLGSSRVSIFLSWRPDLGVWESEYWDPMDARALARITATDGTPQLVLGNHIGRMYRIGKTTNDGWDTNNEPLAVLTVTADSTSISTVSNGTGAGWNSRVLECKVSVVDTETGTVVGRTRIASSGAVDATFANAIAGLTIGRVYLIVIGGVDFQLVTGWRDMGAPFESKRFDQALVQIEVDSGETQFLLDAAYEFDAIRSASTGGITVGSGVLDVNVLDEFYLGDTTTISKKVWLGKVARAWRLRVANPYNNQGFTVTKLATLARALSSRFVELLR